MFEWLDVVLGAGLTAAAFWAGERRERRRKPGPDEPICGCTHHYSMHDESGCNAVVGYHWEGPSVNRKPVDEICTCKRYTGPEPLPRYIP